MTQITQKNVVISESWVQFLKIERNDDFSWLARCQIMSWLGFWITVFRNWEFHFEILLDKPRPIWYSKWFLVMCSSHLVSPIFSQNFLSFKLLKGCYLHIKSIRIDKQILFSGRISRFVDSKFVKLSDEPIIGWEYLLFSFRKT